MPSDLTAEQIGELGRVTRLTAALERMVSQCSRYLEERPQSEAEWVDVMLGTAEPSVLEQARTALAQTTESEENPNVGTN